MQGEVHANNLLFVCRAAFDEHQQQQDVQRRHAADLRLHLTTRTAFNCCLNGISKCMCCMPYFIKSTLSLQTEMLVGMLDCVADSSFSFAGGNTWSQHSHLMLNLLCAMLYSLGNSGLLGGSHRLRYAFRCDTELRSRQCTKQV